MDREEIMFCCKCQNDLANCICEDKEERVNSIMGSPSIVCRICQKCGKHYSLCKCEHPEWTIQKEKLKSDNPQ